MAKAELIYTTGAREDIYDAYAYYEDAQLGLGDRFLSTMDSCIEAIVQAPKAYRFFFEDIRGFVMPTFPYLILYRATLEEVQIVSVFHTSRDPKPWEI